MLIKNAEIIDYRNCSISSPTDILIKGNVIEKIGKIDNKNEEIIDASDCFVGPGLTNTHAHVPMTLLRGSAEDVTPEKWFNERIWIYEKNLKSEDVYFGALLGAYEMLLNGVTTVFDHYFSMDQVFKAYKEIGIRADLSWAVFGIGEGSSEAFDSSMKFIQKYNGLDDRITISLGPHSPYICPESFLRKIVDIAKSEELKIHIHASEVSTQVKKSLIEKGKTPIQYLYEVGILRDKTILAHAYYSTPNDFELIKETNSLIAHAPKTYLRFADIYDFLPKAISKGVSIGLASDGVASNGDLSIFEAAKLSAILAKASTRNPTEGSIEKITPLLSVGDKFLGKPLSSVKEGVLADLIFIDKNSPELNPRINIFANLLYNFSKASIKIVLVNGKKIIENGKLLTLDISEVIKEVNKISSRLLQKTSDKPMQFFG